MIYSGKLAYAELYDSMGAAKTNVKQVWEARRSRHPGRCIVTNAHWFDPGPRQCGNYKVDGVVLSNQWPNALTGFGWNTGEPKWTSHMDNYNNFVCTIPALINGERQKLDYGAGVERATERTWFGRKSTGEWCVEVTTANYTLDGIVDRMAGLGITDGMVFDGSGSSQLYDGTTHITGDGRTIYSYLLCWFEDTGREPEKGDKMKVYLSPSSQPENKYAAGDTTEQVQCNRIAEAAKTALERCGFEVKKAPEGQSYQDNVAESNAWGADLHIPIHTNAGGGAGTVVFVNNGSTKQLQYANPIYDEVQAITPGNVQYGVRINKLYELSYTVATAVYVECEFHDRADLAEWIIAHVIDLGEAIAKGVCTGAGVKYIPADEPEAEPEPEEPPMTYEEEKAAATEWAKIKNISDGTRPYDPVQRVELWVTLWRLMGGEK